MGGISRKTSGSGPGPVPDKPPELRATRLSDPKKPDFDAEGRLAVGRGLMSLQLPRPSVVAGSDSHKSPTRLSPTGPPPELIKEVERPLQMPMRLSPEPKPVLAEPQPVRSPSPDRPYQGVGRLIDQWQKKAEAGTPKSPVVNRRGGLPVKRAGISNSGRS